MSDDDDIWRELFGGGAPLSGGPSAAEALTRLREDMFDVETEPVTLGRLTLLERLGKGGMGTVFAAFDPVLARKVAVKVLHLRSDDATRRALREGRLLARLSHPNVVVVHEVQEVRGRVHIVMEYVAGGTLRAWCAASPPWRRVVELFCEAGRGLAAAHAAGIVHGDFKPENVLLEPDGSRPRVADFGLASSAALETQEDLGVTSRSDTQDGSSIVGGTAGYAPPEQVRGDAPGPRSDQFSFCVCLFEALFGQRPFTPLQLAGAELSVPPLPPSEVPSRVRTAVLRGLRADPARRHASMDALLSELQRATRPRTARNVGLLAGATGLLLGATSMTTLDEASSCQRDAGALSADWNARRDGIRRAVLGTGHVDAEVVAAQVLEGADAYVDDWVDAWARSCEASSETPLTFAVEQRCLLDQRDYFDALLEALVEIELVDLANLATTAASLQSPRSCFERPTALPVRGPEHAVEAGEVRRELTAARVALDLGRYAEASDLAATVVARAEALDATVLAAEGAEVQASALAQLRDRGDAMQLAEDALWRGFRSGHHGVVARLANLLLEVGEYESVEDGDARIWLRAAQEAVAGAGRPAELAVPIMISRARLQVRSGRAEASAASIREAHALALDELGPEHPLTARTVQALGVQATLGGEPERALELLDQAEAVFARHLYPTHPSLVETQRRKADALLRQRRFEEAEALLRQTYGATRHARGHEEVARGRLGIALAEALMSQHEWAAAKTVVTEALSSAEPGSLDEAIAHEFLAIILSFQGEREAALEWFERSVEIRIGVLGEEHHFVSASRINLGSHQFRLGRCEDAVGTLQEALAQLGRLETVDHARDFGLRVMAGRILLDCGQVSEAEAATRDALRRIDGREAPKNSFVTAHKTLAHVAVAQGRWDEARKELGLTWSFFEEPSEKMVTVAELEDIARAIEHRRVDGSTD